MEQKTFEAQQEWSLSMVFIDEKQRGGGLAIALGEQRYLFFATPPCVILLQNQKKK